MNNLKGPLPFQGDLEALLAALGAMRQSPNSEVGNLPPGLQGAIIPGSPGSMKLPQFGIPGGIPQNAIPRAKPNQFGMTRVSPGMYKDSSGKIVRSENGMSGNAGLNLNRVASNMPPSSGGTPNRRDSRRSAIDQAQNAANSSGGVKGRGK